MAAAAHRGSMTELTAADGHRLGAYVALPSGQATGGVVILQEIFGVNGHIRHLCDDYAKDGFVAVAPALFDRTERGVEFNYTDYSRAREIVAGLTEAMLTADVQAAIDETVKRGAPKNMVAPIGYCFGGAVAYQAACRNAGLCGAVNYYGTRTIQFCETMTPHVPVMYHFGALDKSLPPAAITKIKAAHPVGTFHVYEDADHGFSCDERPQFYNAAATTLAKRRTLAFLADVMQ